MSKLERKRGVSANVWALEDECQDLGVRGRCVSNFGR